jgi:DNA end-binding protein Ku
VPRRESKQKSGDEKPRKQPAKARAKRDAKPPEPTKEEPRADDDAPVARGVWSGSISFGLVTVPVELFSATRRGGVPLRMLTEDGVPVSRRYVSAKDQRELGTDEIERGYEIAPGEFVTVSDEELEGLAPRRSRDIDLARFVPRDAIDPAYFVQAYFLLPAGDQSKAYHLLAETMERTNRAALANIVMRGKAYALAIFADGGLLRAETLRFGDELRSVESIDLPAPTPVDRARVAKMAKAIESLAESKLDEAELTDDSSAKMLALAREKQKRGEAIEVQAPARADDAPDDGDVPAGGAEVVDLVSLIRERLRNGDGEAAPKRAAKKSAKRKPASGS